MSSFLQKLADQRTRFLEGLDANEGDINLDIFEDFYPDQAHFVFELLQNAEDAGATEAAFILTKDGCSFDHNGTRTFTEADVKAITGIHNSTKSRTPDQIGKFGVGFKSVFVYTLTPTVCSGDFSFKISRLVLPELIERDPTIGTRTRFWLPFNNPKKTPEAAYAEIEAGLSQLAETTLLFLSHLESMTWQIDKGVPAEVRRIQHSVSHLEMLKQTDGKTTTSSHFLKFDQPVEGLERQRVAVAFTLDFLPNVQQFDPKEALAKQLKIIPATPGRVAVFFPAEKETSGLRFHLHAPFVPELSRASIKDTPANQPLFRQLATLTTASLHQIRDLGLLTAEFLSVLPNPQDQIPPRYEGVRAAIVEAMNTKPLTPTYTKSHAPAKHLLQAKASLKDLLSEEDVEFLVGDEERLQWAIGAAQKNSNADRFLTGLAITEWDVEEFVQLASRKASEGTRYISSAPYAVTGPDPEFTAWLSGKAIDWHQRLYSLLYAELNPSGGCSRLKGLRIVRLSNGGYSIGGKCFFPSDGVEHDEVLPRVDANVYTFGKSKTQQENAKKLLEEIGVRDVGEAVQVEAILRQRYTKEAKSPNDKTYRKDLKDFVALLETEPDKASLFGSYWIFKRKDGKWGQPSHVFLDQPFLDTGLSVYHDMFGDKADRVALAESYQDCGVAVKRLVKFAEAVGVQTRLEITTTSCYSNPKWLYLSSVGGDRRTSPINRDYVIRGLEELLAKPSLAIAKFVWRTMGSLPEHPNYLEATYRRNHKGGAHREASQLTHQLRVAEWIPQGNEVFVRPAEASRDLLPEGFPFDPGWPWLKAIGFGQDVAKKSEEQRQTEIVAKKLGFANHESLERAKRFAALPPEEQERILADRERGPARELPDHEPANPERRAERVGTKAADAPERRTEERARSVSIGRDEVKQEAAQYLCQQYTNADGEMICQVCKAPLPFKLDDGTEYFEKVEFLPELKRRHYQNYLALCPNHAAMFQYANSSVTSMQQTFAELTGNDLQVVLARRESTIYFTKTHVADLKEVIRVNAADVEPQIGGCEG